MESCIKCLSSLLNVCAHKNTTTTANHEEEEEEEERHAKHQNCHSTASHISHCDSNISVANVLCAQFHYKKTCAVCFFFFFVSKILAEIALKYDFQLIDLINWDKEANLFRQL